MSKRAKTPRGRSADGEKRQKIRDVYVGRPFEGLADEPEWIALRELVPAASAPAEAGAADWPSGTATARSSSRRSCRWRGRR